MSPTRLAVHNVPKDLDERALKQMVLTAVKQRASKQTPHLKQVSTARTGLNAPSTAPPSAQDKRGGYKALFLDFCLAC